MKSTKFLLLLAVLLLHLPLGAQKGIIRGEVTDMQTGLSLPYASINVNDLENVVETDTNGIFQLELEPGYHKLAISYLGYTTKILHQIKSDPIKPNSIEVTLLPKIEQVDEIAITANGMGRTNETPLSIKTIGINEIMRLPGSTIDVSKVIKNLPGVLPKVSFGYNIIVRGGASLENKFFIDGIEIPSINHFSVQGVSGGPNGLINVDILRRANLITGAFPANRFNALSSVLNLETRSARKDRIGGKFTLGATDVGLTLEGPISEKTSYIVSARKSFSEYYLKAFKLPVLPAYTDYNFKIEHKGNNSELKLIGVGAWDQSRLNLADAEEPDASVGLRYNTGYIPEGNQAVHTLGLSYKKFSTNGYSTLVLSNSYFRNKALKYFDNTFLLDDLWYDYDAARQDSRFRVERTLFLGDNELEYGISGEYTRYSLDNQSIEIGRNLQPVSLDFESQLNTLQYGAYFSNSTKLLNEKLQLFGGVRIDASTYNEHTRNPFNQFSPRISASLDLGKRTAISASAGSYFQLPPSVMLAYSEDNALVNRDRLKYIQSRQLALGYQYQISEDKILSVETFYKNYTRYPFLLRDSISFANANADYVAVGNQGAESTSAGRSYGLEVFVQKKFRTNSLWSATYNLSKSEFADGNGNFVASSWDTRHFLTLVYARTFGNNWQIGAKFTYASSSPYTPFDLENSSRIDFWELNRRGTFDFERLNTAFLKPFHQLDFRIDKNIYRDHYTANFYLDIQNLYSSPIEFIPYLVPVSIEGVNVVDPADPSRYLMQQIASDSGRVLPTIGVIIEL